MLSTLIHKLNEKKGYCFIIHLSKGQKKYKQMRSNRELKDISKDRE